MLFFNPALRFAPVDSAILGIARSIQFHYGLSFKYLEYLPARTSW